MCLELIICIFLHKLCFLFNLFKKYADTDILFFFTYCANPQFIHLDPYFLLYEFNFFQIQIFFIFRDAGRI